MSTRRTDDPATDEDRLDAAARFQRLDGAAAEVLDDHEGSVRLDAEVRTDMLLTLDDQLAGADLGGMSWSEFFEPIGDVHLSSFWSRIRERGLLDRTDDDSEAAAEREQRRTLARRWRS